MLLPKDYKLLFMYIKDTCDHAGIWKPNVGVFNKINDTDVCLKEALQIFNKEKERIHVLKNGRWFLTNFIPFQYGLVLNGNNRVHDSILRVLSFNGVNLRSIRPLIEVKDRVKDKDKDKDSLSTRKEPDTPKYCHDCEKYYYGEKNFEKHLKSCEGRK